MVRTLKTGLLMAAISVGATMAQAAEQTTDKVLACVGSMNTDADWAQCRTMIFEPCATDVVGTSEHLACLETQKTDWLSVIEARRTTLSETLTTDSLGAVTDLYGQWIAYVGQKCPAIALKNADISKEAAQLGCEISEAVGIASEFEACLQGTSTAPYCIHTE